MKNKKIGLLLAAMLGLSSALMFTGCGILDSLIAGQNQSGPINAHDREDEDEDEEEELNDEGIADTSHEADAETEEDNDIEGNNGSDSHDETSDVGNDTESNGTDSGNENADAGNDTTEVNVPIFGDERPSADEGRGTIKELEAGDIAPDFTVSLTSGESFKLSDYDDRLVLINFWATWCGPCVGEMPELGEVAAEGGDDYVVVCINCGEDQRTVDSFASDNGYDFNIAYDSDYRVEEYYPTDYIPYTVIVKNGIVCETYIGAPDDAYKAYKNEINKFLNE